MVAVCIQYCIVCMYSSMRKVNKTDQHHTSPCRISFGFTASELSLSFFQIIGSYYLACSDKSVAYQPLVWFPILKFSPYVAEVIDDSLGGLVSGGWSILPLGWIKELSRHPRYDANELPLTIYPNSKWLLRTWSERNTAFHLSVDTDMCVFTEKMSVWMILKRKRRKTFKRRVK